MSTATPQLKAPFIWFGGKRRVASLVWRALGDVDQYVEPFAGSLAVLLGRPEWHRGTCETVNDADCYLSNFWRALAAAPDEMAHYADWPVNECDLVARHLWLVNEGRRRIAAMESDPDFYDVKVAGWWVWGLNSWIGSGWCAGKGPWQLIDGEVVDVRKLPHLGNAGRGTNRQRPQCSGDKSAGPLDRADKQDGIALYFQQLAARLRKVRVCCGDWSRVVTDGALSYGSTVGVFLDPPYRGDVRTADLYAVDDHTISVAVRDWAIANGDNPRYRIALCGYRQEHEAAMPETWQRHFYSASKSYGTTAAVGKKKGNDANRHNEAIWFSPHCMEQSRSLFAEDATDA
jgi:hypothetical protein